MDGCLTGGLNAARADTLRAACLHREARQAAEAWLARFEPYLVNPEALAAEECRALLGEIPHLRREAAVALCLLEAAGTEGLDHCSDVREALLELDGIERGLRDRSAPPPAGSDAAVVTLGKMRARIAESAARREVRSWFSEVDPAPPPLRIPLSANLAELPPSSLFGTVAVSFTAAAGACGLLARGWVGRLPGVLELGLFAAVLCLCFFLPLFLVTAWNESDEELEVTGLDVVVRRRFGRWQWERRYRLGPRSRAEVRVVRRPLRGVLSSRDWSSAARVTEIVLRDAGDRAVHCAYGRSRVRQERLAARLNRYLETASTVPCPSIPPPPAPARDRW